MTSERKIRTNRANAQTSTGAKTASGRQRSAKNALRHALSLPVCSNPALSEEVETLAREIAGCTMLMRKFYTWPATSPKRKLMFAACIAPAINFCPRH